MMLQFTEVVIKIGSTIVNLNLLVELADYLGVKRADLETTFSYAVLRGLIHEEFSFRSFFTRYQIRFLEDAIDELYYAHGGEPDTLEKLVSMKITRRG